MAAQPSLSPLGDSVLLERAQDICAALSERSARTNELRRLPDATVGELHEAGLFRVFRPRRFGGHEMDPSTFFSIQTEFSAACPSTGWTWGVLTAHDWQLALFPLEAQRDVWESNDRALIASSYAPLGKRIEPVPGGYRLHGRWDFCSGIDHADWCFLGGLVPGETSEYRTFLLPRDDYGVDDSWHVTGLRGTGSNSVIVEGAFVPEHRTHRMKDAYEDTNPGTLCNTSALYRLPFGQIFIRSISTPVLGMAVGALRAYLRLVEGKVSTVSGAQANDDPQILEAVARATVEIEMLQVKLRANLEEMWAHVHQGRTVPLARRSQFKFESADVVRRCCSVIEELRSSAGAKAVFSSSPLWLYHNDACAARAHFGNNAHFFGRNFGRVLLGRDNADIVL